jgi:hypothetical protein
VVLDPLTTRGGVVVDALQRHPLPQPGLTRTHEVYVQRPRHRLQNDHTAPADRHPAGYHGAGQELLDASPHRTLLHVEPLDGSGRPSSGRRAAPQTRYQPLQGAARRVVDVGHGVLAQTGLLGDRFRDGPVQQRDGQALGYLRPDDAAARPVQGCESDHRSMSAGHGSETAACSVVLAGARRSAAIVVILSPTMLGRNSRSRQDSRLDRA